MIYDWSLLNKGGAKRFIIEGVAAEFKKMIDSNSDEGVFQRFIEENAGLFFSNNIHPVHIVISKPQLGNDFIPDFLYIADNFSYGLEFHLIELETASDQEFTKKGIPSNKLITAIDQIDNWQIWLEDNKPEFKKLYPFFSDQFYDLNEILFTIIIGRRSFNYSLTKKRNKYAKNCNVIIRSYNYLLDLLINNTYSMYGSVPALTDLEMNVLANPFFNAITYSSWKKIVSKLRAVHFYANGFEKIIEERIYSNLFHQHFDTDQAGK